MWGSGSLLPPYGSYIQTWVIPVKGFLYSQVFTSVFLNTVLSRKRRLEGTKKVIIAEGTAKDSDHAVDQKDSMSTAAKTQGQVRR